MRHYGSFLVHWWPTEQQQQHLSIRHIQSCEELTIEEASAEAVASQQAVVTQV